MKTAPLESRGFFVEEVVRMNVQCPVCDVTFKISTTSQRAEIISCPDCRNKLEVVDINKNSGNAQVKEAPKIEEDWGE